MFREAAVTALIVAGLAVGMVGFRIPDATGIAAMGFRFDAVAAAALLAFLGRIALVLLRDGRPKPALAGSGIAALLLGSGIVRPFDSPVVNGIAALAAAGLAARAAWTIWHRGRFPSPEERDRAMDAFGARVQRAARLLGPAILALAVILPLMPFADRRLLDIAVLVATYVMLGWGLNIVVGLAGLLDLGYVAFYAVGAYSFALLAHNFDMGFWACLPIAGGLAAATGILLGFPVLRLRGDYLAIVTLGFGEMIRVVLQNWTPVTGGPNGISGIPKPTFFGLPLAAPTEGGPQTFHGLFGLEYAPVDRVIFLYYVILLLALLTNAFSLRIRKLPVGRAWEALREDEIACRSLGIDATHTKLTAFAIGAMFGGFAGAFFATRQGFISPESFTFMESAVILAIVVLGGFGSQLGVVVAALLLIGLPEFFRELADFRMLAFGAVMVLIMLWRPAGLLAHREPSIRLKGRGGGT
ncbi:MAG: high-affinity branched-chain amino acid ABC transporter permease LivM [Magnetospirillum sp. WYHS-4]